MSRYLITYVKRLTGVCDNSIEMFKYEEPTPQEILDLKSYLSDKYGSVAILFMERLHDEVE